MTRRKTLLTGSAVLLLMCATTWAGGDRTMTPSPSSDVEIRDMTPDARQAAARGLKWLADQQSPDGSFGRESPMRRYVAVTPLAGLAFMSDGNLPDRGPYGHVVDGCLRFLVDHATDDGLLAEPASHSPLYSHGFATLFLAEVYGTGREDPRLTDVLHRAVHLIVEAQNPEGGWRYQPLPHDADVSVTVCQVMALRAARNVGIHVPKATIERAIRYVKNTQNTDGGFRYMTYTAGSAFARSAAGVAALQYAGIYQGGEIRAGLDYLHRNLPRDDEEVGHFYYGHYYGVQAMFIAGGDDWQRWWPVIQDQLLARQAPTGPWTGQAGDAYATALALIILQLPQRLLPIFQK